MKTKLFISFSGGRSEQLAEYMYKWIPILLQHVDPWAAFKEKDLPQGRDDHQRIFENARTADACLLILTPEGLAKSPWILFEPGMFYGMDKEVFVLLCGGLDHSILKQKNHPLNGFHAYPEQKSMKRLISSINQASKSPNDDKLYKKTFKNTYLDFESFYQKVFKNEQEQKARFQLEESLAKVTNV